MQSEERGSLVERERAKTPQSQDGAFSLQNEALCSIMGRATLFGGWAQKLGQNELK